MPVASSPTTSRPAPAWRILDVARAQVLERGVGLDEAQVLEVLQLPDAALTSSLELAHEVRMRWCGPEVEVEGIVSVKTGGCPEDCHFCSQSGQFASPVRAVWLDIPSLVEAAKQTAATGRHRVLHRRRRARPGRAADDAGARGRRGDQGGGRHQRRLLAGDAHPASRSTSWPRWACTATTTTWRPPARTSRRSSPRTRGRSAGRRCGWCARRAWRSAAAASSGWARPWSSGPSSPRSSPSWTPTRCR